MDAKNTCIFEDLDIIPIYNFDKCLKGELKYMYEAKRGEITDKVVEAWDLLQDEYCELTATNISGNYYRLMSEIAWLEKRLVFVPLLLNMLLDKDVKDKPLILKELSAWKLPVNSSSHIAVEVERVLKALNNSKTKLSRKIYEYNEIKKSNEAIDQPTIQSQAIMICKALDIKPNIHSDSVIMWLEYFKEIKNLNKKQ